MKNTYKFIKRFVLILILSFVLLILLNIILFALFFHKYATEESPWKIADEISNNLVTNEGNYELSNDLYEKLNNYNAWVLLVDNDSGNVIWKTSNTPETVSNQFTIAQIAEISRGYLNDYPTFTSDYNDNLIIVGFKEKSYFKLIYNSWDYNLIASLPITFIILLLLNIFIIFIIYLLANRNLIKSFDPIINGIDSLAQNENVELKEKGLLSEIYKGINSTSNTLQHQKYQLTRKENARANWISSISHDIRTPLSMIMGYASDIENNSKLSDDDKQKVIVIRKQSEKIKSLINDLNLSSKLEYNMQPLNLEKYNIVSILRTVITDFLNNDIENKYSIEFECDISNCFINCDKELIKRAINNVIQNSINHNEKGCTIYIKIIVENNNCVISIDDNGVGANSDKIKELNELTNYSICDNSVNEQRHGIGLLIVKQIISTHNGNVKIYSNQYKGFGVSITLPIIEKQ